MVFVAWYKVTSICAKSPFVSAEIADANVPRDLSKKSEANENSLIDLSFYDGNSICSADAVHDENSL